MGGPEYPGTFPEYPGCYIISLCFYVQIKVYIQSVRSLLIITFLFLHGRITTIIIYFFIGFILSLDLLLLPILCGGRESESKSQMFSIIVLI